MYQRLVIGLLCCCLLVISGCGNKGPLVPAEDEKQKQSKPAVE